MEKKFIELHNHSDFSLLSSLTSVTELVKRAVELNQPAVALTDYNNLTGAVKFYEAAKAANIKPIFGCDLKIRHGSEYENTIGQIVLLAENNKGWHNLIKLSSYAGCNEFGYIDRKVLQLHSEGLIALSAGVLGNIELCLQSEHIESAREIALWYKDTFNGLGVTEPSFFIELTKPASLDKQTNQQLLGLAQDLDIPLVATNNTHFISPDDFNAFEAMLAIRDNSWLGEIQHSLDKDRYLKSYDSMQVLFEGQCDALENTNNIAKRCHVDLSFREDTLPDVVPSGAVVSDYLRNQAHEGLGKRWTAILAANPSANKEAYEARLNDEIGIINETDVSNYFLIVADYVQWAKEHAIPVGPARGTSASSLLAYCLFITDIDPIQYGLFFERFFNPKQMPDIDIDFCMTRREEVIDYVTQKYGCGNVSQIATFGTMKAKVVIRDIGCVMNMDLGKVNLICSYIPDELYMTLTRAMQAEERLAKLIDDDDEVARLFELAFKLEGKPRNVGTHAAGVVIGKDALVEKAPLFKISGADTNVIQWDMTSAEKMGLKKFDFLGLKSLTMIDSICQLLRKQKDNNTFDINAIPMDDKDTFAMICAGQTQKVFQFDQGVDEFATELNPDCFNDLDALIALYRPGPIEGGMANTYIECKHGGEDVAYVLPQLEPILKETYGVLLYQEQTMQIAHQVAGFDLMQANLFRRALGLKKSDEVNMYRKFFIEGAKQGGYSELEADTVFDWLEVWVGYGFSKAHAVSYALIDYQMAYLKAKHLKLFIRANSK